MLERKKDEGFTLTELMVAMVIFAVVMGSIYSAYLSQQKAYQVTETVTEAQQNLRAAMWNLERDLRMAGYNSKAVAGVFGFQTMAASSLIISADEAEDGVAGVTEYTRYQFNAGARTLQRGTGQSGGPPPAAYNDMDIAENITAVAFQYLDGDGNPTLTASAVRTVVITLTATLDNHTRTLTTRVQCRNMGL